MTNSPPQGAPPCREMGAHCDSLRVLLRVATEDAGRGSADHEATWLLGHTERITFLGDLERDGSDSHSVAELQVPRRFLGADGRGPGARQVAGGGGGGGGKLGSRGILSGGRPPGARSRRAEAVRLRG